VPAIEHEVKVVYKGKELASSFTLKKGETFVITADFRQGEISATSLWTSTEIGPEFIKMQTARKRKPALFPHRKHQDMFSCDNCHHGKDDDGNQTEYTEGMEIKHCVSCHNYSMPNKKLNSLMQAAHTRCKGCHKKVVAEGLDAGPIDKCIGCHIFKKEK
jgi:hypothetical protein